MNVFQCVLVKLLSSDAVETTKEKIDAASASSWWTEYCGLLVTTHPTRRKGWRVFLVLADANRTVFFFLLNQPSSGLCED